MRDSLETVVDRAVSGGASYADARYTHHEVQRLGMRNERMETASNSESAGVGLRVLVDGYWGFAAMSELDGYADRLVSRALAVARSSAAVRAEPVDLAPVEPVQDRYETRVARDSFEVSLDEKTHTLRRAVEELRKQEEVAVAEAGMYFSRERKWFASSEGAAIEQLLIESAGGISAVAVGGGEEQVRSYPQSGWAGSYTTAGYELIEELDLVAHAPRVAEEAVALLTAPACPEGLYDIVLGSSQLAIQIHESCGHPVELDRVLGTEAGFAGTSFLTPDKLGDFRYGSEHVTLVADGTTPRGLGTFGYDDEGVPAQRTELVHRGVFVGYLSSRETAPAIGLSSSGGTMRAEGWNRLPLIRMTNVSLDPGEWTLDDLLADTDGGLFLDTNRSWSIDDRRLNFQFGTEAAWEVKGGKLGRMYRSPTYTGITPEFWGACDAVCNREHWELWGVPNCGKGEPMQVGHVGHGASPARFRAVQVRPGS